ncbi:MAG TPA: DUF4192 domain-containing protein [Lapillicoccus sp.]|nr:DUF4192 domain-containing protein [Lapillicoccus sp.]
MTTTIRLRGPADIITVLPYHLGYRPADSLVVVCLRANRIGVVGRVDLPPPEVDPDLVAVELVPVVVRERPDAVVLIGFETRAGQAEPASVAMRDAIRAAGIRVVDRLLVRDGRWWSLDCHGDCCPGEGEALQGDDEVPAVADYIVRGRRPASSRAELAGRLQSQPDPAQETRCAALLHDLRTARASRSTLQRRRRRMFQAWARILDLSPGGPDAGAKSAPSRGDEAWAWAVVSLVDVSVRDLLIAWMCPGTLELSVFPASLRRLAESELPSRRDILGWAGVDLASVESRELEDGAGAPTDAIDEPADDVAHEGLVDRLAMVCREAPPELSPGPLTVLAHVVWWLGDGALARTALDGALEVDPDYRLAMLLARMVDVAVRPRASA